MEKGNWVNGMNVEVCKWIGVAKEEGKFENGGNV